jgi:hypothetical protein
MADRFWEPRSCPNIEIVREQLSDWVSNEVLEAITECVSDHGEWFEFDDGRIVLKRGFGEKPDDGTGITDCFVIESDLLDVAINMIELDADEEEVEEICSYFDKLAADIRKAADRIIKK